MINKVALLVGVVALAGCASNNKVVDDLNELPPTASGEEVLNVHFWSGIGGKSVTNLVRHTRYPGSPSTITPIETLDFPDTASQGDKYGQRIIGLLEVPTTGQYRFYVAADERAEVWLSSDQNPTNARLVAYTNKPTGYKVWNKFGVQDSNLISLSAGERYYFKVMHKENLDADYLSVGWTGPDFSEVTLINSDYLKPMGAAEQVSGETAYKEGYQVGYTSGTYLSQYDDTYPPVDTDGDGLPDFYEVAIGLDPNDVTDAYSDLDGDLLTAYEEYQLRTNPANADTDGDGIPDGFEYAYGMNALSAADALLDSDGDGISNKDEYLAGTAPDDSNDFPSGPVMRVVTLNWEKPTAREDGSALETSDIQGYKVYSGTNDQDLSMLEEVAGASQTSLSQELEEGVYYFAISTVTTDGAEGPRSSAITVDIQ